MNKRQITDTIMMVRPAHFGYNEETAKNNAFQTKANEDAFEQIKLDALDEFDRMVETLERKGVRVLVINDNPEVIKPDAIFPNNWVSFHENGTLILYPMYAPTRRLERRESIIDTIIKQFRVKKRINFSDSEEKSKFLEGTGSMVLDRKNRIAYACLSERTDEQILEEFGRWMEYKVVAFHATDKNGLAIYHTNVLMTVGLNFVVICMDSIQDEAQQKELRQLFKETGKELINISYKQMESFAGNMLQVASQNGKHYLVMSSQAYCALTDKQLTQIEALTNILHVPIETIETYGGGSARCMMAEMFLPEKEH